MLVIKIIKLIPKNAKKSQKKPAQNSRSTVGTYTDIYALMRLLFSRVGKPFVGYSDSFSFNHPQGSCPRCSGLGEIRELILKGQKRLRNLISVTRILGNAGLKAAGEEPDLTDEWLTENMDPHNLLQYQLAVIGCMTKESKSEAAKEETEEHERDLVLEEIEAKKDPVNSHTGA